MEPNLELFDRELALADLLSPVVAAAVTQALGMMLGGQARLLDLQERVLAGPDTLPSDAQAMTVPLCVQLDTVGFLEAPGPLPRLQAAALLVEQVLQTGARYCMAADLHMEAVRSDNQSLKEQQTALLASEARFRELSHTLEQRVEQQVRTIEDSQRSLYHAERLAAVGQLAAGVAHEINNPMGFMRSNLNTGRNYTQRLAALEPLVKGDRGQAWTCWKRDEMTELLQDFDVLLAECISGADRVTKIVFDLKTFSSMDREEVEALDLNDNLRVVCSVAEGQLPEDAHVVLDLQPLPLFTCEGGRINQVFLNILLNGAQALAAGGEVRVSSALISGEIRIVFEDNGGGIPAEVLARVFDPFFTTRPVGSGTGLGLTVTRDIVRGYGGVLDIASKPGSGTRVVIRLPAGGVKV
jgi:two-component system, NtrC family, sensor kinase